MRKLTAIERADLERLAPYLQPDPTNGGPPNPAALELGKFDPAGQAIAAARLLQSGRAADEVLTICPGLADAMARGAESGPLVRIWTDAELLAANFPAPLWIVPDLIPAGLTLLAGRPKLGKSWLALQLAMAMASGGMFLGHRVPQGRALYIALEDSERRLNARRRIMPQGEQTPAGLSYAFSWPALNEPEGLALLRDTIMAQGLRLVVVDTLARVIRGRLDWDDIGQVTAVMADLQALASDLNVCLLLVDHHRKGNGLNADLVDDVMGSTGKSAVADTIMGLYRKRGEKGATLAITGRDIEEQTMILNFDAVTCCWQPAGTVAMPHTVQGRLIAALEDLDGEATTTDLADALDVNKGTVSKELQELVAAGRVKRGARVGRTIPYRLT